MSVFSWFIIIEHGTVLEQCAIDAGLTCTHKDRDMWTYSTDDKNVWLEFEKYRTANKKAIDKESLYDRYQY